MKTIQHSTYLYETQRRLRFGRLLMWTITLAGAFLFAFLVIRAFKTGYPWFGIFLTIAYPAAIYVNPDRKKLFAELKHFTQGIFGENLVAEELKKNLSDEYTYIQNYVIPNSSCGDIDGILIGPHGILLIEVKHWLGIFLIKSQSFFHTEKKYRVNPYRQVEKQYQALTSYVQTKQVHPPILKLIVLVGGTIQTIEGKTGIYTIEIDQLHNYLKQLKHKVSQTEMTTIIQTLLN